MGINYDMVIRQLESNIDDLINELRVNKNEELLNKKLQFSMAVEWLKKGMRFQIHPKSKVKVLPEQKTMTPSSEYRIIEDHESDNKEYWTEVRPNGEELRPSPGDFVIIQKWK